ncbi:hypothetical protein AAGV28_08415 [Flavobacterium sp. FZUC8N2.13]|uniref:Uncharacterized protein n=1 Tax=Flavobacterium zubiriense TaxID=3138075 RepID=A0ABV4TBQ8_9FLAO
MKKYLFIVPIVLITQYNSAQALTKNGSVVTESTVSTLKVGDVTYPNTDGQNGQVLSTNGDGTTSWTSPSTGGLATVFNSTNVYLDDSYSGSVIYVSDSNFNGSLFNYANNLPAGFTCTIINTKSNDYLTVEANNEIFYYQIPNSSYSTTTRSNVREFKIRPEGTVRVNVITVNGQKRIYVTGDLIDDPA